MKHGTNVLKWFIPCLFLTMLFCPHALAEDGVTILDYSIKPVGPVSSGNYIETAWEVKLGNESENPVTCIVTILFKDKDEESLKEATKKIELKGHEVNTCSDKVLLSKSIVGEIVSTGVSVEIEQ